LKEANTLPSAPLESDQKAETSSTKINRSAQAAEDDFKMFSIKKRGEKRGVTQHSPTAPENKAKGKRKANDMDTTK
jgi:hypothetical protein